MRRRTAAARARSEIRKPRGWASPARAPAQRADVTLARGIPGEQEVEPARLQIHARDPDPDAVGEPEGLARAVAHQLVPDGVEVEIVLPELGDVHQPLDVELVERDE